MSNYVCLKEQSRRCGLALNTNIKQTQSVFHARNVRTENMPTSRNQSRSSLKNKAIILHPTCSNLISHSLHFTPPSHFFLFRLWRKTLTLPTAISYPDMLIPKLVESPNYGKGLWRHLKLSGDDTHLERDFSMRDGTP